MFWQNEGKNRLFPIHFFFRPGSVAPGVQQPYEIWIVSGLGNNRFISLECTVYPNPTAHNVTLKVQNFPWNSLNYHLFDANGKFLDSKKIVDSETTIKMDYLNPAIYYLRVLKGREEVIVFKINKK